MERWRARSAKNMVAQLMAVLVPAVTVLVVVRALFSGLSLLTVLASAVVAIGGALGTRWAWRHLEQRVDVTLDDGWLTIAGHGRHHLSPGSLMAVRVREHEGGESVMGTVVSVRLENGHPLTLLFVSIVPGDLYFGEGQVHADLAFDPGADALLDRLVPFLAPRVAAASPPAALGYSMVLRKPLLSRADVADSLSIVGDSIAIGKGGQVRAQARAHEIAFTRFTFGRAQSVEGPPIPDAPAVVLQFMREGVSLSIGANPIFLDRDDDRLPVGDHPDYLVGAGELMRLLQVLEAGRRRYAPTADAPR